MHQFLSRLAVKSRVTLRACARIEPATSRDSMVPAARDDGTI